MTTAITVKTPANKTTHIVEDYSFGDVWLSLTIDSSERVDYNMAYVEFVQVQELDDD